MLGKLLRAPVCTHEASELEASELRSWSSESLHPISITGFASLRWSLVKALGDFTVLPLYLPYAVLIPRAQHSSWPLAPPELCSLVFSISLAAATQKCLAPVSPSFAGTANALAK